MLMSVTQSTAGTLVGNLCFIAMFPLLVSMHMQKGGYERGADVGEEKNVQAQQSC